MKKGDLIDLEIEKYAFEGKGIAKINADKNKPGEDGTKENKFVVFVEGAYPGDNVTARVLKVKKSFAEAAVIKINSPSRFRTDARCIHFGTCGGCKQQDMDYNAQVKFKQEQVEEIFRKMGGFNNFIVEEILPSEKIFFYRNKMEFSFSDKMWLTKEEISSGKSFEKNFALGLHIPGIYDKVLDITRCYLQSELSNKILDLTRTFFKNKNILPYSTKTNSGYLRNLVIKDSHYNNDLMVNLVTSEENDSLMTEYAGFLIERVPEITTIVNNINLKKAAVAAGDYERIYHGSGFIYDAIGSYKFRVSANSFFQTNTLQAEKLYKTALDFAGPAGEETVYDLYSGAGTISIFVSGRAKEVYAFESAASAVSDAEENKKINNVPNVHFFTADLYKSFLPLVEEKKLPLPHTVILDPPRSGMHRNTVDDVIKLNPEKIVYVSCNPATQVRDIKLFTQAGYNLEEIRPVDMFPHTYHIENVALLERK